MHKRAAGRIVTVVIALGLLMVALAWVVRSCGEARLAESWQRFEAEAGSLDLADYVLPALADNENAALWLRAGAESLLIADDGSELMAAALSQELGGWSVEMRQGVEALITENQLAFEQLEKCRGLASSSFGFAYQEGFSAITPPMLALYRTGRLVALDLRLALTESDVERVSRDLEILNQLSRALARESFVLSAIIHLAVEQLFLGAVRDVIEAGIGEPTLLITLQQWLDQRPSRDALRRGLAGEAAAVLAATDLRGTPMDSTARGDRLRYWLLESFQLAALLDRYGEVIASLDSSWKDIRRSEQAADGATGWAAHEFLLVHILDAVDKLKAVELGQRLTSQAVWLSLKGFESGELAESLVGQVSDPYAAGGISYERAADGSAILSAPEALDLWLSQHQEAQARLRPVFVWRLPAP